MIKRGIITLNSKSMETLDKRYIGKPVSLEIMKSGEWRYFDGNPEFVASSETKHAFVLENFDAIVGDSNIFKGLNADCVSAKKSVLIKGMIEALNLYGNVAHEKADIIEFVKSIVNDDEEELSTIHKAYNRVRGYLGTDISKGREGLVKKKIQVVRAGKTHWQYVWVRTGDATEAKQETPVGEEVSPSVNGMDIVKYSEKSILVKGDTYVNKDALREVKKEIGSGVFNRKLKGWIFPIKHIDKILGILWSGQKDAGNEEKADAIQNQKNASLEKGSKVTVNGLAGTVTENKTDSEGIKYDVKLDNGAELSNVSEKVIETLPEKNDKKIKKIIANVSPENRAKTTKNLFGIKPIEDIHNYSLGEYMEMHGITKEELELALKKMNSGGSKPKSTSGGGGGGSTKKKSTNPKELTRQQLISKLIYNHYQACKKAIDSGVMVSDKSLKYYPELVTQKKPMTEETKRKISEALKKNGTKEEEKKKPKKKKEEKKEEEKVEITDEVAEELTPIINKVDSKETRKEARILVQHEVDKADIEARLKAINKKRFETKDHLLGRELMSESGLAQDKLRNLNKEIRNQKNKLHVLQNGGEIKVITDKIGESHKDVPDFRKVDTSNIHFDIDNILSIEKPHYIPEINETAFQRGSYIFDAIRFEEDSYMIAVNKYSEGKDMSGNVMIDKKDLDKVETPDNPNGYVVLTLDQLVLTQDYYTTKKKAEMRAESERRNQRALDSWDAKEDKTKERYLTQRGMYRSLPAKVKKKVSEEQWEAMSWQERETHYKPVKRYGVERLKSKFDAHHMASTFHAMTERFVNPELTRYKMENGKPRLLKRSEQVYGTTYANPLVFQSWRDFSEMLEWKINDINIERESDSEMRNKATETSYGESNTNSILLEEHGVKVKRQNGEDIKPEHIENLKDAWVGVQSSFGKLTDNAKNDNLKLSHAGKTFMFASKAIGVYVPSMKTIGVTEKFGKEDMGFTMGHEVAHWIDNTLGETQGKRFASSNYESTAGQIAIKFRKSMNAESSSKYINSTHECFARALEQYNAINTKGEDAEKLHSSNYFAHANFVSKDVFETTMKPLIEKFLEENKTFLKSIMGVHELIS